MFEQLQFSLFSEISEFKETDESYRSVLMHHDCAVSQFEP